MKTKRFSKPVKILLITVAILLFLILSFYYGGFRRLSQILTLSNRGIASVDWKEEEISAENQKKLTFVKQPDIPNFYVDGFCLPILSEVGIGEVSFSCVANYTVYKPHINTVLQQVKDKKFKVKMRFQNWKWVVEEVQTTTQ